MKLLKFIFIALLIFVSVTPSNSEQQSDILDFLPVILGAAHKNNVGPLNAPSGLMVSNPNPSSATLIWTDTNNNEIGYSIYMATSEFGTYSYIDSVSAGTNIYLVSGLVPSTTYWFKITAYNTDGESDFNLISFTTPPASPSVGVFGTSQWDSGDVFGQ